MHVHLVLNRKLEVIVGLADRLLCQQRGEDFFGALAVGPPRCLA